MQELRAGNLIDIVNTYLLVALRYGYVGLALFCAVFAAALWAVITALRRQPAEDTERFAQGQAILGMLFAVLVTIATVSDISFIPILWWSAAGLAIGYGHLVAREAQPEPSAPAVRHGLFLSISLARSVRSTHPRTEARALRAGRWSLLGLALSQAIRFAANLVMTRLWPEHVRRDGDRDDGHVRLALFSDLGLRQSIVQSRRGADRLSSTPRGRCRSCAAS